MAKKKNVKITHLLTKHGQTLPQTPWNIYPRPALKRDSFLCLNGSWDFTVSENGTVVYDGKITVPFCPESLLSGVNQIFSDGANLTYTRKFTLPDRFNKGRVILHFGGVDQVAKVYINGNLAVEHAGGYTPFFTDITEFLQEENTVTVQTTDALKDGILPYGKQTLNRGGMWYTPVSGIWQTVWLESVPNEYISSVSATVSGDQLTVTIDGVKSAILTVNTPDGNLTATTDNGVFNLSIKKPVLWSPENPYLYRFTVQTDDDKIESYFAIRTLTVENIDGIKRLCVNGKPTFFHGLLDQGYFSDGIFTPASPEVYTEEIKKVKALGFNTLRKHIKIEPQHFYYECDRLGLFVWQDMVNNGDYKFIRDTVLPTIGLQKKRDKRIHKDKLTRDAFVSTMKETVALTKKHPSVVYYTIFNEGWGQFDSDGNYKLLKSLDDTRFIDTTSGWFKCGDSDVESKHIYFNKLKFKPEKKPLVLSEFGGLTYAVEGHIANDQNSYGYGGCANREEFVQRLRSLYKTHIIPGVKDGLCASIYTQVSDVEDEINGLFTYDRKVDKITPEEFKDISDELINSL